MKTARTTLAVFLGVLLAAGIFACSKKDGASPGGASSAPGNITWMGYTDGMAKARQEGKPVMVDFYTTWCKYCKMMDDTTYKDPEIARILSGSFVTIKVNAEGQEKVADNGKTMTEQELAANYKVSGYPTMVFFDDKGKMIGPLPGYSTPEEFKPVLTFITSGAYAKGEKYEDYLKSVKK